MSRVLLRADQGVVDVRVLPQGVGNGADGGSGVTEDPFHALPGQALHQNLRACSFHVQQLLSVWKTKKARVPRRVTDLQEFRFLGGPPFHAALRGKPLTAPLFRA